MMFAVIALTISTTSGSLADTPVASRHARFIESASVSGGSVQHSHLPARAVTLWQAIDTPIALVSLGGVLMSTAVLPVALGIAGSELSYLIAGSIIGGLGLVVALIGMSWAIVAAQLWKTSHSGRLALAQSLRRDAVIELPLTTLARF